MAIGIQVTKTDVNQALGTAARSVFNAIQVVGQFKDWLDTQTDADLIALNFVQSDVDQIRSAMADLGHLRGVFFGVSTRAVAYDYRTFTKRCLGTGLF